MLVFHALWCLSFETLLSELKYQTLILTVRRQITTKPSKPALLLYYPKHVFYIVVDNNNNNNNPITHFLKVFPFLNLFCSIFKKIHLQTLLLLYYLFLFFIHSKLVLLTQFPASNDKSYNVEVA